MTYVIVMQPPLLPPGEYRYTCTDDTHLRRVTDAMKTLSVEIIDVERDGESLTLDEYKELLGE